MRVTAAKTLVGLSLALLLTGCFSNEPSSDDILYAIRQSPVVRRLLMLDWPGVNLSDPGSIQRASEEALDGAKVEKLGCVPAQSGVVGINCEYRLGLNRGRGELRYQKLGFRFVKVDGTWQIQLM